MSVNRVGKEIGVSSSTIHKYAKKYKLKGVPVEKALSVWTVRKEAILKERFHNTFNRILAAELGVSTRSLVRRAHKLGLKKEDGFLEKNRKEITAMAMAANPPHRPANLAHIVEVGKLYRFKKGHNASLYNEQRKATIRKKKEEEKRQEEELKKALKNPY